MALDYAQERFAEASRNICKLSEVNDPILEHVEDFKRSRGIVRVLENWLWNKHAEQESLFLRLHIEDAKMIEVGMLNKLKRNH